MIDKSLVKKRFKRSLETYSNNAIVQKQMANKLITLLPRQEFTNIFEIGCSSGVLTKCIAEKIKYNMITVNDIVQESKKYIDNILSDYKFLSGDIENIDITEKYDLIISNACIQWCNNIKKVIDKLFNLLGNNGILAVSGFGSSNLQELRKIFNINENEYSVVEFKQILNKYEHCEYSEEVVELYFSNLREILLHLKYTGANSIKEYSLTKTAFKKYEEDYIKNYSKNGKLILTYNPVYIIINKNN